MTLERNAAATQEKKAYKTPSLTKYGQLKDLTTGGSQNGVEGSGTGNKNKKN